MSDDGSNLAAMIAALDQKAADIERQANLAREEIQAVNQKLDELRREQAQATSQLATSRQTLATLPASERARQEEIRKSIQSLEQKQQATAAAIQLQVQAIQQKTDAQKREAEQHTLRRAQSAFVVQVGAALTRISDGAVRYLFATKALAACEARKITPDIFEDAANQKVIADILGRLDDVRSRATADERRDAATYSKLVVLQSDTGRYLEAFLSRVADNEAKRSQIAAGEKAEQDAISALASPETPEQKSSRNLHRLIAVTVGVLLAAAAGIMLLAVPDLGLVAAAFLAFASLISFWFAWLKSDRYRAQSLASKQASLAKLRSEAEGLNLQTTNRDQEAQKAVSTFAQQLTESGIPSPPAAGRPADDIRALNEATRHAIDAWCLRHSDIRLLGSA